MATDIQGDENLFMLCQRPQREAFVPVPNGFHARACQRDELATWMAMPFDTEEEATTHRAFMESFFERVYAPRQALFFERCTFLCDAEDRPVATAFIWPITAGITTFHWLKVLRGHEGKGLGRAVASHVMRDLPATDYPILLHTHPGCQRAIELYSRIGFDMVSDAIVGSRSNDYDACMAFLLRTLPAMTFETLHMTTLPPWMHERLRDEGEPEF